MIKHLDIHLPRKKKSQKVCLIENVLKMDYTVNCKMATSEIFRGKLRERSMSPWVTQRLLKHISSHISGKELDIQNI